MKQKSIENDEKQSTSKHRNTGSETLKPLQKKAESEKALWYQEIELIREEIRNEQEEVRNQILFNQEQRRLQQEEQRVKQPIYVATTAAAAAAAADIYEHDEHVS